MRRKEYTIPPIKQTITDQHTKIPNLWSGDKEQKRENNEERNDPRKPASIEPPYKKAPWMNEVSDTTPHDNENRKQRQIMESEDY